MNLNFLEALEEIEREKEIKKDVLVGILEKAITSAYKKNFGTKNVEVIIDKDRGNIEVYQIFKVVEKVEKPGEEISLEEAKKLNPKATIGMEIKRKINPRKEFKRIAAQTAKQVIKQKIKELEKEQLFQKYHLLKGKVTNAQVIRVAEIQGNVYADIRIGKLETKLPKKEWIPGEQIKERELIKVYVKDVQKTSKGPKILVSRSVPEFVVELLKLHVPEIEDGIVKIMKVYREPGVRTKIAVTSEDPRIDPVGACIGEKGIRIESVLRELKGEKVDIVRWSEDPKEFIKNALSPAKVLSIEIDEEEKKATIYVTDDMLSLAIGKGGQNARIAAKLTGWKIDIHPISEKEEVKEL